MMEHVAGRRRRRTRHPLELLRPDPAAAAAPVTCLFPETVRRADLGTSLIAHGRTRMRNALHAKLCTGVFYNLFLGRPYLKMVCLSMECYEP